MNKKYEIKKIEQQAWEIQKIRGELVDSIAEIDKELAKVNELEEFKEEVTKEIIEENSFMAYRNTKTNRIVYKEDILEFLCEELGFEIKLSKDKQKQKEFLKSNLEWFFDWDWEEIDAEPKLNVDYWPNIEGDENYDDI